MALNSIVISSIIMSINTIGTITLSRVTLSTTGMNAIVVGIMTRRNSCSVVFQNLLAETMDKLHEPDVAKRRLSFSRSNAWNKIPPRIMMLRGRRVRNYLPPAPRAFWQNVWTELPTLNSHQEPFWVRQKKLTVFTHVNTLLNKIYILINGHLSVCVFKQN